MHWNQQGPLNAPGAPTGLTPNVGFSVGGVLVPLTWGGGVLVPLT